MAADLRLRVRVAGGRRGSALIYVLAALVAFAAFCSLAVDLGRVQLAKTELQSATDAACRYGAAALGQGIATVRARAKDAADDNKADGTAVVLADADVEQGFWDTATKTFTANGAPVNAVRVTGRRTAATGNAIPLLFASLLRKESFDLTRSEEHT